MKVVHITPQVFGPGRRGGGERYVSELVTAQQSIGIQTSLVEFPRYSSWRTVDGYELGRRKKMFPLASFTRLVSEHDIVHVHQLNSPGFDAAIVGRTRAATPVVVTDHGGGFRALGRFAGRARNALIDGFGLVSEWSAEDLGVGCSDPRLRIFRGGGDHVLKWPNNGAYPAADFLYVGRILPHKGLHVVLMALPRGSSLRVVGEFRDNEYRAQIRKLSEGLDVEFLEGVDDADLHSLYSSVRCTLMPSVEEYGARRYKRPELLGLVALESLVCRTPVVGSQTGGLGHLLRWAGQRTVPPGDVDAWSSALSEVLTDVGTGVGPTDEYRWASVAKKAAELYQSVLEG